jgi:hypothetical protein
MARGYAVPSALAVLCMMLAGCADAKTDSVATLSSGPAEEIRGDPLADEPGFITGTVVDTELVPIGGVDVIVTPGEHVVQTNDQGAFKVGPLEAGSYQVRAEKAGYNATEVKVTIQDDKPSRITLTIIAAASTVPYHESRPFAGYLMCHVVLGNPAPPNPVTNQPYFLNAPCVASLETLPGFPQGMLLDKWRFPFKIEAPGFASLVLEMKWNAQQLGKDGLMQLSKGGAAEPGPAGNPGVTIGNTLYGDTMANPFHAALHAGRSYRNDSAGKPVVFYPTPNATESMVIMYAGGEGNTTVKNTAFFYEFRSDIWLTFFYHRSMTPGFTIFPDK